MDVVEELLWRGDADVHANDDEALLWATDNGHEVRACSSHAIMPYYCCCDCFNIGMQVCVYHC